MLCLLPHLLRQLHLIINTSRIKLLNMLIQPKPLIPLRIPSLHFLRRPKFPLLHMLLDKILLRNPYIAVFLEALRTHAID